MVTVLGSCRTGPLISPSVLPVLYAAVGGGSRGILSSEVARGVAYPALAALLVLG
jgi:hypothetical protein